MIYLLYGPDVYSRSKKIREMRDGIIERNPSILRGEFDLEDDSQLISLHEFVGTPGLFSDGKRFAIVRNGISRVGQDLFSGILKYAAKDPDSVLLLNEDTEQKKLPKKVVDICKEYACSTQFFPKLSVPQTIKKVKEYTAEMDMPVSEEAVAFLSDVYGGNIYAIMADVEKWSSIFPSITKDLLLKTGEYAAEVELFGFSQTILFKKSIRERTAFFEHVLSQKIDLYAVFNVLAKATSSQDLIEGLADGDIKIKKGLLDIEQVLTAIVLT